jgi:uncharacterized membrane-anchored protein
VRDAVEGLGELKIVPDIILEPDQNADYGLVLAYVNNARLVVSVGQKTGLNEFLSTGGDTAAEQLLTRIRVGDRLVDAKGVSLLYHAAPTVRFVIPVIVVGLVVIIVLFMLIPSLQNFLLLLWLNIRAGLGF